MRIARHQDGSNISRSSGSSKVGNGNNDGGFTGAVATAAANTNEYNEYLQLHQEFRCSGSTGLALCRISDTLETLFRVKI